MRGLVSWGILAILAGCDPAPDPAADAGADTGATCARACDDGLFCNGVERCAPGDPAAGADGCVAATTPCDAGETCVEASDRCEICDPTAADADGDEHASVACGGDDCDDADASRFPGNVEVCDASHDEDCDDASYGFRDMDGDGYGDDACCNGGVCGRDCDDGAEPIHPGSTEACDEQDNDCDGAVDEGVVRSFYPDCDGDSDGAEAGGSIMGCGFPPAPPSSCGSAPRAGWSFYATDCDDNDAMRSGRLPEIVDDIDNNCNGRTDELFAVAGSIRPLGGAIVGPESRILGPHFETADRVCGTVHCVRGGLSP